MSRMTRLPSPEWRRLFILAPAALIVGGLLVIAGCGQDDQHVPETYPSGARPAQLPDASASTAQVQLPPEPPAEPSFAPSQAAQPLGPKALPTPPAQAEAPPAPPAQPAPQSVPPPGRPRR